MSDRYRRRPFDAWDPYRDDPPPGRRSRWQPRRLLRIAIPFLIAAATFGHDIMRLFEAGGPASTESTAPAPVFRPAGPALDSNRLIMPDNRTILPRHARPADSPAGWITPDDYPASALRENLQGVVGMRFTVQPDGRVHDCVPVRSSGSLLLDSSACGVFALHARYWPARDRQGRAIAESAYQQVRWQIPKD